MTVDLLALAREVASHAHAGQVDKHGVPYIEHPRAVAASVRSYEQEILAWLHDVVEDTAVTLEDLAARGFPESIVLQVDALTHRRHEPRRDYYARVMLWPDALVVKIADVHHNLSRLEGLPEKDQARLRAKYGLALSILVEDMCVCGRHLPCRHEAKADHGPGSYFALSP